MDKVDYTLLKNIPGLTDHAKLEKFERPAAAVRATEKIPSGNFDQKHIQAIHKHLFQDVYDWAGQIRALGCGGLQPPKSKKRPNT